MKLGLFSTALGYAAVTYAIDVPLRRALAAHSARAVADAAGRPLLNVGAGTGRTALFGSTLYGDVNLDLGGRRDVAHGPGVVTWGDAQDLRGWPDGYFGAVLASHILEHLDDPRRALAEWKRVTGHRQGALFVVTPSWWAPHTWLHPEHKWTFADGAGCTVAACTPKPLRPPSRVALRTLSG